MRRGSAIGLALLAACSATSVGPYTTLTEETRSTTEAEQLNRRAADLITSDPGRAESLLRDALTKDIYFGPAHNNLGVLYLKAGKLYEAANELEWARKLLPGNPDPRINLGLVLERAGRTEEALKAYEAALEVTPECIAATQGAASLVIRSRWNDRRLASWLGYIATRGEPEAWRRWALDQSSSGLR